MFIIGDHDPISIHFYGAKPTSWHLWHHNMATRLEKVYVLSLNILNNKV
jgi:hypothetical protein